jgi:hypothetical protein
MREDKSAAANAVAMEGPSKRQILKATAVAIVVAAFISVSVVLPAEYGLDPLHTGAALGLLSLSKSAAAPGPAQTIAVQTATPVVVPAGDGDAPVIKGVFVSEPSRYKVDSRELKLGIGEGMEIKYHMQKGSGMVYSWTANRKIQYEFHGEPDVKPAGAGEDYFESYEKDDAQGKKESHGAFTAPSTGIQGWFWDNESDGPVTIKLVTAGFYDYILQNKDDVKTRLQPTDPQ